MFGYVRPKKADLLMREFTRYRAVYCGLCKALSDRYGQVPRLALTYDLTFFALLFLGLSETDAALSMEGCVLNPIRKKPVSRNHPVLELAADFTVLLAGMKLDDDAADEGGVKHDIRRLAFRRACRRARKHQPQTATALERLLSLLTAAEDADTPADPAHLAGLFGDGLAVLFEAAAPLVTADAALAEALAVAGRDIGRWIYLIDAVDDYAHDVAQARFNALLGWPEAARWEQAATALLALEASLDRTLALLPYRRDGGIMRNIALAGLPDVRDAVFAGRKLTRL